MPTILPPPSPVIAVLSQKGGTGKTTLVRTLTDVLRRAGLDVLAVDLDPQGNLSDYFDVDPDAHPTIGEVLSGRARAIDAIHKQMIPANLGLAEAELVLSGKMGRELTLKRALHESRRQFDLILIDCPPALGLLTVNALVASTHALVSAEGEYFSLQGVEQVLEVMQLARENLNEGLDWLGVVMNIADLRTIHSRDALKSLHESFDDRVFETVIRRSIRYPESAERGVSILDYSPELGRDYLVLADELLARLGDEETRRRVGVMREDLAPAPTGPAETHPEAADDAEPPAAPATPAAPTGW
jgi:chromosome partitioning protein